MELREHSSAVYREHNIVFNPSGNAADALADVFMILAPTANPMFTKVLYEHSKDKVQTYGTEEEAYCAAMTQARAWIDTHLDGTGNHMPDAETS